MDIKEKLMELLDIMFNGECCVDKTEAADFLIAHGATMQECGYWVSLTDCANAGVYCSVCHKKVYKEDYAWCNRKNKLRSDYCPNCGARMDGENDKV